MMKKNGSQAITENLLYDQITWLLDEFDGQFDLLNFEQEDYLPIEYDLDKILNYFSSSYSKSIEITFKDRSSNGSLISILSPLEFEKYFKNIYNNCKRSIDETGLVNTYISLGSIKYNGNIAPCLFIPVFIKQEQQRYIVSRNYNQEIQFNTLLKIVLKEDYCINLPEFMEDVKNFIDQLNEVDDIEYIADAYVSNFDLRFNHIFSDLNLNSWNNLDEKFNRYIDEPICNFQEFNRFAKELINYSKDLKIKDDYLFLKSLLCKNKTVLVIGDKHIRNKILNNFYLIDCDALLLELSNELSKEEFKNTVLSNNHVHDSEIIDLDNLVKNHNRLRGIVKSINNNLTFASPKQIKEKKDYYLNKINELQLNNFTCNIRDVSEYDESICKEMEKQILSLFSNNQDIFKWYKYFSTHDLNTSRFNSLVGISDKLEYDLDQFSKFNTYLNKRYSIKIFKDLFFVDVLNNLFVLNSSPEILNEEDILNFNKLLKDYHKGIVFLDDDVLDEIGENVKYTELIYKGIIDENKIELIKNDFKNFREYVNYFIDFSNYLIREFTRILDFYNKFELFEIDEKLLNVNNSLDDLRILFNCFRKHLNMLLDFKEFLSSNVLNRDVENFAEFILENDFNENEIKNIFWFNIYDSLLNEFLIDNPQIDEEKMLSEYEWELKSLKKKLNNHNQNLLIQKIYSRPIDLNNTQIVSRQKIEFINDFPDEDIKSIRFLLDKYKEFITANKRVFLMDMASVSQFLCNSYENYFDYVIITERLKYNLDELSLLLRSKNKIILIEGDAYD